MLRRADRTDAGSEDGFTLVELMVTMLVMGVVVTATMSVLFSAYDSHVVTLSRAKAQNEGRFALEHMSKQIRQATSTVTEGDTSFVFNTYTDADTVEQVEWRSTTDGLLQTRVGTSGPYKTMVEDLQNPSDVFDYVRDSALVEVDIKLDLGTESATIELRSRVGLRNT